MARKRRARRVSRSRLARTEKKKLRKQTFFFGLLTLVLIVVLIYFGIPALIRMAIFIGDLRGSNQQVEQIKGIPPSAPQLAPLVSATQSGSINIGGFAQAETTVVLYRDGSQVEETLTDDEGEFEFKFVKLYEGENEFWAIAENENDEESQPSTKQTVIYDTKTPALSLDKPNDGQEFSGDSEKTIAVEGSTDPEATVYVNDRYYSVNSNGGFSARLNLSDGDNKIVVKAVDDAGNEIVKEIRVKFNP